MNPPNPNISTAVYTPNSETSGSVVAGRYKLLQQLGEGGFGIVYLADQREPVARTVALKIVKPGMDSAQVTARFEQERQALAMMDHPGIAKVLDAGLTEMGRPFFVMELVKGIPITKFCDQQKLTPRQRLELFIPICQAIQHAHQKGIIHRDIKPSNVLVALKDSGPVPKVIDFGVAKALNHKLTNSSLFTEIGSIIGTLEYMSPEQAELTALDIDTRADIYALGVLLYELLTGTTPLESKRLRGVSYVEAMRIIKEEEPPKPSTRWAESKETRESLSALRSTEPARVAKEIQGELDWIVMKCLEKDRTRRYETAIGLARDVERYLADEPIEASPPSKIYRFKKFLRRNKGPVLAAAFTGMALVGGIVGTTIGMLQARDAESRAKEERSAAIRAQQEEATARQLADERFALATETLRQITLQFWENMAFWDADPKLRLRLSELTRDGLNRLLQDAPPTKETDRVMFRIYANLVDARVALGDLAGARRDWEDMNRFARMFADSEPENLQAQIEFTLTYDRLGNVEEAAGDFPSAREANLTLKKLFEDAQGRNPGDVHLLRLLSDAYRNLGNLELNARNHEAASTWLLQAQKVLQALKAEGMLAQNPLHQRRLDWIETNLTNCQSIIPQSIEKMEVALQQPADLVSTTLGFRGHALARANRHLEAAETAAQIEKLDLVKSQFPLEAVTLYAACIQAAGSDREAAERYAKAAMGSLRALSEKGYFNSVNRVKYLTTSSALAPLRQAEDFQTFLAELTTPP